LIDVPPNATDTSYSVTDGTSVKEGQRIGSYKQPGSLRLEAIVAPVNGIVEQDGTRLRYCRHPVLHGSSCVYCGVDTTRLPFGSRQLFERELSLQHPPRADAGSDLHSSAGRSRQGDNRNSGSGGMQIIGGGGGFSLRVAAQHAAHLDDGRAGQLAASRRLVLVLDLDHTLVHATNHMGAGAGELREAFPRRRYTGRVISR
jgi:hypothetical protein